MALTALRRLGQARQAGGLKGCWISGDDAEIAAARPKGTLYLRYGIDNNHPETELQLL